MCVSCRNPKAKSLLQPQGHRRCRRRRCRRTTMTMTSASRRRFSSRAQGRARRRRRAELVGAPRMAPRLGSLCRALAEQVVAAPAGGAASGPGAIEPRRPPGPRHDRRRRAVPGLYPHRQLRPASTSFKPAGTSFSQLRPASASFGQLRSQSPLRCHQLRSQSEAGEAGEASHRDLPL